MGYIRKDHGDVRLVLARSHPDPVQWPFPFASWTPVEMPDRFLLVCKRGTLQYVLLKPLCALISLVCWSTGTFYEGEWQLYR